MSNSKFEMGGVREHLLPSVGGLKPSSHIVISSAELANASVREFGRNGSTSVNDVVRSRPNSSMVGVDGQTARNVLSAEFCSQNGSASPTEHKTADNQVRLIQHSSSSPHAQATEKSEFTSFNPLSQFINNHTNISNNDAIGITHQPTLLPITPNRDFHDSSHRRGDSTFGNLQGEARLANISDFELHRQASQATASVVREDPHRHNMGYNSTSSSNQPSWRASPVSESKMESEVIHGDTTRETKEHDDDSATIRSTDSASVGSPALGPHLGIGAQEHSNLVGPGSGATTPSTVSTAPSTNDEGSFGLDNNALERLALRNDALDTSNVHRRGPSWENPPYQNQLYVPDDADHGSFSRPNVPHQLPQQQQHHAPPNPWNSQSSQRIASFRNEYGYSNAIPDQRMQPQRFENGVQYGGPRAPYSSYHIGHRPHGHGQLPPVTPPRSGRGQRILPSQSPHRPPPTQQTNAASTQPPQGSGAPSNPRSPSEVLKTLLRKKACLYEPDTSRAVALVTWLVGRELALEFGYFSRQQLQAGVHACVSGKIDSGVITRTKVNRCMQIILNSCFHYIIPRPDGTEENGDGFRGEFAREVTDDNFLLKVLPVPWDDLHVERDVVVEASASDTEQKPQRSGPNSAPSTPQSSPRLNGMSSSDRESPRSREEIENDNKRAVLLCFNENVRCAEDVFRCHNEFIRDTAHASGLQLSSLEWRAFFGKAAAEAPHLWGNVGIPIPRAEGFSSDDALGMMTTSEIAKFRTSWCSKRYDHDHDLCGFAHVEVNGGWLRRNPEQFKYSTEMCPNISRYASRQLGNRTFVVNACPKGLDCEFAHSPEEIMYHPHRYKCKPCPTAIRFGGGCHAGDVCAGFHSVESYKFPAKKGEGRMNVRQSRQLTNAAKGAGHPPSGAPILYCTPAPVSRFEEQFQMPGLRNLYRRHCSVMRAYLRNPSSCVCCYSCFGDDVGTSTESSNLQKTCKRGLPQPRSV